MPPLPEPELIDKAPVPEMLPLIVPPRTVARSYQSRSPIVAPLALSVIALDAMMPVLPFPKLSTPPLTVMALPLASVLPLL